MKPISPNLESRVMQVKVPKKEQQLAGFLIESLEGLAVHSRGIDENHLNLLYNLSCESELKAAIDSITAFCSASIDNGDTHHV